MGKILCKSQGVAVPECLSCLSGKSKSVWKTQRFFRMWPRALFHLKEGKRLLRATLSEPAVYVLYRDDTPYYIGKTSKPLIKRVGGHAPKPNWRRYNFWNYFSTFTIKDERHRDEVEAILISAMPTAANSSKPRIPRMPLDRWERNSSMRFKS